LITKKSIPVNQETNFVSFSQSLIFDVWRIHRFVI
jgi:hypothetical protein